MVTPGVSASVSMRGLVLLAICCGLLAVCAAKPSELELLEELERVLKRDDSAVTEAAPAEPAVTEAAPTEAAVTEATPDEATMNKLWGIEMMMTQLAARCAAWEEFVKQEWVLAEATGGLSVVCPGMRKAEMEYKNATPEQQKEHEQFFMANLDHIYMSMACTNLFVTFEALHSRKCKGDDTKSMLLINAKHLIDDCMANFESEKDAEEEAANELAEANTWESEHKAAEGAQARTTSVNTREKQIKIVKKMVGLVARAQNHLRL